MADESASKWTFERWVAVINLTILVVGSTFAAFEFFPKSYVEWQAARATSQTITRLSSDLHCQFESKSTDGYNIYYVWDNEVLSNPSSLAVDVTYSVALLYVGELKEPPMIGISGYEINDPPNPYNPQDDNPIRWGKPIVVDPSWIPSEVSPEVKEFFRQKNYGDGSSGGGMAETIKAGGKASTTLVYRVRARPGQYIAVVFAYGVDNAIKLPSPNVGYQVDFKMLEDRPDK